MTVSITAAIPASATTPGPNGQIAFRRIIDPDAGTSALFIVNPAGTGERQITRPASGTEDAQPDWSPDGRLIAFQRCAPDTACASYLVRPDGTHLTRLTARCTGDPARCVDESGVAFMPDGRHVVYTRSTGRVRVLSDGEGWIEHSDLVIRDLATGQLHVVFRGAPFSSDNVQVVASPEGAQLAFQRQFSPLGSPAGGVAVFVINVDGTHLHRVTPYPLQAGDHPDWSPDGRWILLRSNEDGNFLDSELYVVHADGTGLHAITRLSPDTLLLSASFSPDGRSITYAQTGRGGVPDIFTMRTDGTRARPVTRSREWDSAPDWGPGRRACGGEPT